MGYAKAHVVGAGLAGLNAATLLAQAGLAVSLSDSAARAGGRCRSYFDPSLGLTIDNGNHLVLASNPAVKAFRKRIGAIEPLAGPPHADFAFTDLASGERWKLRINDGPIPWWVAVPSRRVPGTGVADYLPLGKLLLGRKGQTIGEVIPAKGPVWDRMLAPVMLAVLNTDPAASSAVLAANVLKETLAKGGLASAPRIAMPTLGAAFIDPAVDWLAAHGCKLATGRRLKGLRFDGQRVAALLWADGEEMVSPDAAVVLAVPAWVAADLVPGLAVPDDHRAIVNAHFACQPPADAPEMLGLLNSTSEWVFTHPDRISVTISAADRLVDVPREELARTIWAEVTRALRMEGTPLPPWQIVKEKRATFAATPQQDALRPGQRTACENLFLAGDWVQTGLPATIEGALRSGDSAARLVLGQALVYGRGA
jgi:squalene-associated FAD-dependent desaturase